MKKLGQKLTYTLTAALFILSSVVLQFANVPFASAATLTWTGDGDGSTFADGDNWNTDLAPVDGDILTFNAGALTDDLAVTNDIVGLSLAGINFIGTDVEHFITITGNELTLTGDVLNSSTGSADAPLQHYMNLDIVLAANVSIDFMILNHLNTLDTAGFSLNAETYNCQSLPELIGSGTITLSTEVEFSSFDLRANSTGYTGNIIVDSASIVVSEGGLGTSAGGTTVTGMGRVSLYTPTDMSWSEPFTLSGTGAISAQHGSYNGCSGDTPLDVNTATLTGPVTLLSDFLYAGADNLTITGAYDSNGYDFTVADGATGTLTIPDEAPTAPTSLTAEVDPDTGNLVLDWNAPASDGRSPITDYRVQVRINGESTWYTVAHAPFTGTAFEITSGLTDGETYDIRVNAVNGVGVGDAVTLLSVLYNPGTNVVGDPSDAEGIGEDVTVTTPNTAVRFLQANPLVVLIAGVLAASFFIILAIRRRA